MISKIKSTARNWIRILGYEVKKNEESRSVLDINLLLDKPESLHYYMRYRNYYISLPFDKARTARKSLNDFIYTSAIRDVTGNRSTNASELEIIKERLSSYFKSEMPLSASGLMGLDNGEVPLLEKEPSWLYYYPWDPKTVPDRKKVTEKWILLNERGLNLHSFGNNYSEEELIELESMRLLKLYQSIRTNGYIPNHNNASDIACQILVNSDSEYRWLITGGHHRCAVCAALGYKEIETRILNIIYRSDYENWPGVKSKIFSDKTALKVFDTIFK